MRYREDEVYQIFRLYDDRFVGEITLRENMCQKMFDRMIFFKYSLPKGNYKVKKSKLII